MRNSLFSFGFGNSWYSFEQTLMLNKTNLQIQYVFDTLFMVAKWTKCAWDLKIAVECTITNQWDGATVKSLPPKNFDEAKCTTALGF